jgi:hypothetical protein
VAGSGQSRILKGGRRRIESTPLFGSRSRLKVGDILTSCILWGPTPESLFEPGIECNLSLELMFWEEYGRFIRNGMSIQLNEGSRIVGKGIVTGVIAPSSL